MDKKRRNKGDRAGAKLRGPMHTFQLLKRLTQEGQSFEASLGNSVSETQLQNKRYAGLPHRALADS